MATKYEYYVGVGSYSVFDTFGGCYQSFTPQVIHAITKVRLLIKVDYVGSAPTAGFAIYATDGDGHASGEALCVAQMLGSDLPHQGNLAEVDISFSTHPMLNKDQLYSIGFWWITTTTGLIGYWSYGANGGNYALGKGEHRQSGAPPVWTEIGGDFWFEEWGLPASEYPSDTMTRVTGLVHRYSPGNYTLEVFLGDTKTDWDTSKPEIAKPSATLPKREPRAYDVTPEGELVPRPEFPTYMKPTTPTAEEMEEYAGMSQVEYDRIIRQNAIQRALKEFGPISGPEDLKKFTAKYPSLRIGQGIPKIGTPEYARWMLGLK